MSPKYSPTALAMMAVPLYAGPVLAGWMHAPIWIMAGLAAIFFLAQILAGKLHQRRAIPAPVYAMLLLAVQIIVVTGVSLAGYGLSILTGPVQLPPWLALLLTGTGATVLVLRYAYSPEEDQMLDMLDQATQAIETGNPLQTDADDPAHPAGAIDIATDAINDILGLPDDASARQLAPLVQRIQAGAGASGFPILLADIDEGYPQVDLAMLRYLANPAIRAEVAQGGDLGFALSCLLTSPHPDVRHELIAMLRTLLDEGAPPDALPPADEVKTAGTDWPGIAALAARIAAVQG